MSTYGTFRYTPSAGRAREHDVTVDEGTSGVLSIECPCCGRRSRLNSKPRVYRNRDGREVVVPGHRVYRSKRGLVTVTRPVICPNGACGWFVRITKGQAKDSAAVDDLRPDSEPTPHLEGKREGATVVFMFAAPGDTMELF